MTGPAPSAAPRAWTVGEVLRWTQGFFQERGLASPRLDAELLLAHVLEVPRIELYVRYAMPLGEAERARYRALIKARAVDRWPVAYLLGYREFYGLRFSVDPRVLIPRPETESVVERARGHLEALEASTPRVLDLGTGSGAIAVALARHVPGVQVVATDLSEAALDVARANAEAHGVAARLDLRQGDLFAPIRADERFDAVLSNPPYVDRAEAARLMPEVRDHEPAMALFAGDRGMALIARLVAEAADFMHDGAILVVETGSMDQIEGTLDLLASDARYAPAGPLCDIGGGQRGVCAVRAPRMEVPT